MKTELRCNKFHSESFIISKRGEIVQISNINDPNRVIDETIKLLRNDVLIK